MRMCVQQIQVLGADADLLPFAAAVGAGAGAA